MQNIGEIVEIMKAAYTVGCAIMTVTYAVAVVALQIF